MEPSFVCQEDHSVPLLHVSASCPSGTLLDPKGKEGATRLLLRLMRRSTQGLSADALAETVDRLGATLGGEASRSAAGLHGSVIGRNQDAYLELLHRVITAVDFDEQEFSRIKAEADAEWVESLDSDSSVALKHFSRAFFGAHPYGRSASGTRKSLQAVTLADLESLYRKQFSGPLYFAFAGDFDLKAAEEFSLRTMQKLPHVSPALPHLPEPLGPQGRNLLFVDKPSRTQTQILVGCLGSHPTDDDHIPLFVGHTVFGGTFSGRLSSEVRGKRGWSYGAYSHLPYDRLRQSFYAWTFPAASDAAACLTLMLQLLKKWIEGGITKAELARAKKYLRNSNVFTRDTASKRASEQLDALTYQLPVNYHDSFVERVMETRLEDVNRALKRRLSHQNLLVTVLGTEADIYKSIHDAIPDLNSAQVVKYDVED